MQSDVEGVWASSTPIRQGVVTVVDLPDITGVGADPTLPIFKRNFDGIEKERKTGLQLPHSVPSSNHQVQGTGGRWLKEEVRTEELPRENLTHKPLDAECSAVALEPRQIGKLVIWPEHVNNHLGAPPLTVPPKASLVQPLYSELAKTAMQPQLPQVNEGPIGEGLTSANVRVRLSAKPVATHRHLRAWFSIAKLHRYEDRDRSFALAGFLPSVNALFGVLLRYVCRRIYTWQDVLQIWLLTRTDENSTLSWQPVRSDTHTYHPNPELENRVLSFSSISTPTWVSLSTERRHDKKPRIISLEEASFNDKACSNE
ncbi:hypothetical protein DENSPDRAFT_846945 [Dentipellis sp. KUC8613]|nr:hypothetical protein DENSPDRAFT_846945 [Dentipellis sp. KUC8613]